MLNNVHAASDIFPPMAVLCVCILFVQTHVYTRWGLGGGLGNCEIVPPPGVGGWGESRILNFPDSISFLQPDKAAMLANQTVHSIQGSRPLVQQLGTSAT